MRRFLCVLICAAALVTCAPRARALAGAPKFEPPVRLHVIAESDDERAQALKLLVRDAAAARARALISDADSAAEAYEALVVNLRAVRAAAYGAAKDAGYEGEIHVSMQKETFPARIYGNVLLEEGEYHALRVEIGEARGRNWWCVLYPSLCLYGAEDDDANGEVRFYSSILKWLSALFGGGGDE